MNHSPCSLLLVPLLLLCGCYSTREVIVDYPLSLGDQALINEASPGSSVVMLADSQKVVVDRLQVDSLVASWEVLESAQSKPLAEIISITFVDPEEYWDQTWKGMVWAGAGFAVLATAIPAISGEPVIIGEVAAAGFAGAIGAFLTRNLWGHVADPRVRYLLSSRRR